MNRANPMHPRPRIPVLRGRLVNAKCCPLDEAAVELCEPEEELEACRTGRWRGAPTPWAVLNLKRMSMRNELLNRITIEPGKCGGCPCIRGMRIRVQDILDMLAAGTAEDEILRAYLYLG